jgi:hypothetical protein
LEKTPKVSDGNRDLPGEYRAVWRPPAEIEGLTTNSYGGGAHPSASHSVGTIGTPRQARACKYLLSMFHPMAGRGFIKVVARAARRAQARNSCGRSTESQVLFVTTRSKRRQSASS